VLSNVASNCVTAIPSFYSFFSTNQNDSTTTVNDINWVNIFSQNIDARLNSNSVAATGADFSNSKFGGEVGVSEISNKLEVDVYPNPTSCILNIKSDGKMNITMYNSYGQLVVNKQSYNFSQIEVSELSTGIYTLLINNEVSKKILIQ